MNAKNLKAEDLSNAAVSIQQRLIYSAFLEREVIIDVYLPYESMEENCVDLLLVNDGQDMRTMNFNTLLDSLIASESIEPLVCVGIHCGANRMQEYGTICCADYKGRGSKAGLYSKFIFDELLPFIKTEFNIISFREKSFAGFSLGGLSALDMVWNHADEFVRAGIFSGALWWRRRGYEDDGYDGEKDRIMHLQVQKGFMKPGLQFFFECGKLDETADRNNNGIIDSIEDTADLIAALEEIGYTDEHIFYLELEDGRHNIETWKKAFPAFLRWGWGNAK
jgi:enterochelin esterase-like enzyme